MEGSVYNGMRKLFGPADLLTLIFLVLLIILTLFSAPMNPTWPGLLSTYVILGGGVAAAAAHRRSARNSKHGLYLSAAVTVVTILFIFNSLGKLIAGLRPGTFDNVLVAIDHALFGVHPTVWMERLINPPLTALLQFAYISYYFIPLSLGFVLIAKGRHDDFDDALFGIVLCFYLSYVGYLLVPAIGPRFTLAHLQTADLQAGPFIATIQETLNGMEKNKTDAFPSGHTAVALMTLYYAWKKKEGLLAGILLPVASALVFSTVYLRYHYVIDVIAGIALTGVTIALAPGLRRLLSGAPGDPDDERHGPS